MKPRHRIPENCQSVNSCAAPEGKLLSPDGNRFIETDFELLQKTLEMELELEFKETRRKRFPTSCKTVNLYQTPAEET